MYQVGKIFRIVKLDLLSTCKHFCNNFKAKSSHMFLENRISLNFTIMIVHVKSAVQMSKAFVAK